MSLDVIRDTINNLDEAIIHLLDRRARAGREIGELKRKLGLPLRNEDREREVLLRLRSLSDGSLPPSSLDRIYRAIMAETLAMQREDGRAPAHCDGPVHKRDFAAEVLENKEVAPGFYRMRLRAGELTGVFQPGQFFQIRVGGTTDGLFLRRPFAPSQLHDDGISFVYAVVGSGTETMTKIAAGSEVAALAPLGGAYRLPDGNIRTLLIGGGCGAPSLAPLAGALRERGHHVAALLGARTSTVLLEHETFAKLANRLIIATDDGSGGCRGTVIDAFRRERESVGAVDAMFACGPVPMLRAAAALAEELGVPCQVSLEERMACGFGACMGCVVPVRAGGDTVYRRVCHDGPVFDSRDLAWDQMR